MPAVQRQLDELREQLRLLQGGDVRRANMDGGMFKTIICTPQEDVDQGEPMVCDILEGPIYLETSTGDTLIGFNSGSLIPSGTRCEAVHFSQRRGGEPHPLTGPEVSSLLSIDGDAISSTTTTQYAYYEIFNLEC